MRCPQLSASGAALLDPAIGAWSALPAEVIGLSGTPLATQPSGYVRARFDPEKVGRVKAVEVRAAHNSGRIYFRLSWQDDSRNVEITENNQFPDGCGVLLPLNGGEASMQDMGSEAAPVNAWFWRADRIDTARNVVASGLGTTRATQSQPVAARAAWADGVWTVVFARDFDPGERAGETARLAPGTLTTVGFAVWEGGNGERGGVKAYSREWRELAIE